jgi:hypothetical protein
MPRRRTAVLSPDALADELAAYLNIEVDPHDFAPGFLFERWQEETSPGASPISDLDDLHEDDVADFTRWLTTAPSSGLMHGAELSPLDQERQDEPLSVPSYLYFHDARPAGPDLWCIHFTKHVFQAFGRGATIEMLGLSTHYREKAQARCSKNLDEDTSLFERVYGFAFEAAELSAPRAIRAAQDKYGKRAVLFQTDAGVSAFHDTDHERQIVFPLCSERNVHGITLDSFASQVWIDGVGAPFGSLAAVTTFLDGAIKKPRA